MDASLERDAVRRFVRRTFAAGMTLLALMLITVAALDVVRERAAFWTHHAREVARTGREALLVLGDLDAATTGVALAHDGAPLDGTRAARELALRLDALVSLTTDNPVQHERARRVREVERRTAALMASGVAAGTSGTPDVTARAGRSVGDGPAERFQAAHELRSSLTSFIVEEDRLYRSRERFEQRVRVIALSLLVFEAVLLAIGIVAFRSRLLVQGDNVLAHREQLGTQNERLGQQNEELRQQTDQLAEQAIELEVQHAELEETVSDLREERERFSSLLHSLTDTVYSMDDQQRLTEVFLSRSMEGKWNVADVLGKRSAEVVGPESAATFEEAGRQALAGTTVTFDWAPVMAGTTYHYSTTIAPLRDASGAIRGAVGVTRDRTEEFRRRAALADVEDRLRQSQKLEAVGQLAGGVAHDFNNLLTVILSYASFLEEDLPDSQDAAEAVDEIRNAATRAAELTRQLLTFSRKQAVETELLDVCEAVRGVEQLVRRLLDSDVTLALELDAGPCMVIANRGQFGQILINLAVNANAAMPDGGTLHIETANVELDDAFAANHAGSRAGPHIRLRVADDGEGMSEETLAHIFEPFFTTKAVGVGTGLGLSTVYGIVQQWGGCIDVTSTIGRGSTFCIYLPAADAPAREPRNLASAPRSPAALVPGAIGSASRPTVLLVDDDDAVRSVALRVLRSAGYEVLQASNGIEALRRLDESDTDVHVVLSDMIMPDMGGRELAYEVRVRHPEASLVLMSGYTRDTLSGDDPLRADAIFIGKPFDRESLLAAVAEACSHRKLHTPPLGVPADGSRQGASVDRRALDVLINGVDAVVWEADAATGHFHYVSRRAESLLGHSRREWKRDDFWSSILHPEDRDRVLGQRERASVTHEGFSTEYRLACASGQWVWVRDTVCVVSSRQGSGMQFRGVMLDITETRRGVEALRASHEDLEREHVFLSAVLENLTDGVVACDENFVLTLFNPAMRQLVGRDVTAVSPEDRPLHFGLYTADGSSLLPPHDTPLARALRGEVVRDVEMSVMRPDGELRRLLASGEALRDRNGTPIGAVLAVHDVTQVHETMADLRVAKEAAERAAHARTQFLALVSHELHTPLNAVIGFADVLRNNSKGTMQAADLTHAERIAANGRRLLAIVRDMLDLTAIQGGTLAVGSMPVTLQTVVRDTVSELSPMAQAKQLAMLAVLPEDVEPIAADSGRLRQVMRILVGNAIKFTDKGSVEIRVVTEPGTSRARRIEVCDTGPGIDPGQLEAVFQPFHQQHEFASRNHGGTGLGLSIARALCEAMGFTLTIESAPGDGTRCVVRLAES